MVPCYHGAMGLRCEKFQPGCCEADFGSRIKILGYPLGRSASFFEIHLFRLVPGLKIDFFKKMFQMSRVAVMVAEKMFTLLGTNDFSIDGSICNDFSIGPDTHPTILDPRGWSGPEGLKWLGESRV